MRVLSVREKEEEEEEKQEKEKEGEQEEVVVMSRWANRASSTATGQALCWELL